MSTSGTQASSRPSSTVVDINSQEARSSCHNQQHVVGLQRQPYNYHRLTLGTTMINTPQGVRGEEQEAHSLPEGHNEDDGDLAQNVALRSSWSVDTHLALLLTVDRYRRYYRSRSWNAIPINPQALKFSALSYLLTTKEGSEEVSSLALSVYVMISMTSFLFGDLDCSKEYYHKAREQLGALFDATDYDVATALVPLAWWSRFNSESVEEGRQKEAYCVTLGIKMCETLGAVHDDTYESHVRTLAVHEMSDPEGKLSKAKQYPPYKNSWRKSKLVRTPLGRDLHYMLVNIYGAVLQHHATSMRGGLTSAEHAELVLDLYHQLGLTQELMEHIHNQKSDKMFAAMLISHAYALRMMIYMLLGSPHQFGAAKEMLYYLTTKMEAPFMIISLLELSANGYLMIKLALDIVTTYSDRPLLALFVTMLAPYQSRYYWIRWIHQYTTNSLQHIAQCNKMD